MYVRIRHIILRTTSNIIIMGFSVRTLKSGGGFICSENIGETGNGDVSVLKLIVYKLHLIKYSIHTLLWKMLVLN